MIAIKEMIDVINEETRKEYSSEFTARYAVIYDSNNRIDTIFVFTGNNADPITEGADNSLFEITSYDGKNFVLIPRDESKGDFDFTLKIMKTIVQFMEQLENERR